MAVVLLSVVGSIAAVAICSALGVHPVIRAVLAGGVLVGTPAIAGTIQWWLGGRQPHRPGTNHESDDRPNLPPE